MKKSILFLSCFFIIIFSISAIAKELNVDEFCEKVSSIMKSDSWMLLEKLKKSHNINYNWVLKCNDKNLLMIASENNSIKIVQELLNRNVEVNHVNTTGKTALMLSVFNNNNAITKLLIKKGANLKLKYSVALKTIKISSDVSMDAEYKKNINILMIAIYKGNIDIVTMLLDNGVDVNVHDKVGLTPLLWALIEGKKKIAMLLIEKGANIHYEKNDFGMSPLIAASAQGYEEIVLKMLKKNVDASITDVSGRNALDYAKLNKHEQILTILKKHKRENITPYLKYVIIIVLVSIILCCILYVIWYKKQKNTK